MGSRVRVPYTPQTLPKVQCFRKRFALYVIYILAKFKSCFDRLQSGKTQTCKRTQAQALPLNATSNGGDASRVGNFFSSLVSRERCSYYLVEFVFLSHIPIPTRDASPPLVLAFLQAPNATTKRYHQTQPLMGATRLASGIFSAASSRGKDAAII